jgi:cell shape-determining protein MreC
MQASEIQDLLHFNGDKSGFKDFQKVVQAFDELLQTNQDLLTANEKLENENAELKAALERLA